MAERNPSARLFSVLREEAIDTGVGRHKEVLPLSGTGTLEGMATCMCLDCCLETGAWDGMAALRV